MYNAFNTVIYNGALDAIQFNSATDMTVRNSQFHADGTMDPTRTMPNQAGFGAATSALALRRGAGRHQVQLLRRARTRRRSRRARRRSKAGGACPHPPSLKLGGQARVRQGYGGQTRVLCEHRPVRRRLIVLALLALLGACTAPGPPPPPPAPSPTFSKDIAPILFQHCAPCHRPGQPAPFSLLSYADVSQRADKIAEVTRDRHMPPWLPEQGAGEFIGERRLRPEAIETIQRWVQEGAAEGNRSELPPAPTWTEGWQPGPGSPGGRPGPAASARRRCPCR